VSDARLSRRSPATLAPRRVADFWLSKAESGVALCARVVASGPPLSAIVRRSVGEGTKAASRVGRGTFLPTANRTVMSTPSFASFELRSMLTAPAVSFVTQAFSKQAGISPLPSLLVTECFVSSFVGEKEACHFGLEQAENLPRCCKKSPAIADSRSGACRG
jgi:hypothetical protein